MKKKILSLFATLFVSSTLAVGFAACKDKAPSSEEEFSSANIEQSVSDNNISESIEDSSSENLSHEHSFVNYVANGDETCTQNGTETARCTYSGCNESHTRIVENSMLSHTYDQEIASLEYIAVAANCKEPAVYYKSCDCGAFTVSDTFVYGSVLDHDKVQYTAQEATCTAIGWNAYETCSRCEYTTYVEIPILEHTYDREIAEEVFLKDEATCTTRAVYYKSCTCGLASTTEIFNGETRPHTYDRAIVNETYEAGAGRFYWSCLCGEKGTEVFDVSKSILRVKLFDNYSILKGHYIQPIIQQFEENFKYYSFEEGKYGVKISLNLEKSSLSLQGYFDIALYPRESISSVSFASLDSLLSKNIIYGGNSEQELLQETKTLYDKIDSGLLLDLNSTYQDVQLLPLNIESVEGVTECCGLHVNSAENPIAQAFISFLYSDIIENLYPNGLPHDYSRKGCLWSGYWGYECACFAGEATCQTGERYYYHCIDCGAIGEDTYTIGEAIQHNYNQNGFCEGCNQISLKVLRLNINNYIGERVSFEGVVTAYFNQGVYIEEYDSETNMSYSVYVYYGFSLNSEGVQLLSVGNRVFVSGVVNYYAAGKSYQISDLQYGTLGSNDIRLISENNPISYKETTAEQFLGKTSVQTFDKNGDSIVEERDYAEVAIDTLIKVKNLEVVSVYTTNGGSNDGAMTLACRSGDETIVVRTVVLRDDDGDLVTEDVFFGKIIDVCGIVSCYNGEYQIKVLAFKNINIYSVWGDAEEAMEGYFSGILQQLTYIQAQNSNFTCQSYEDLINENYFPIKFLEALLGNIDRAYEKAGNADEGLKHAIKKESYFVKYLLYTLYPLMFSSGELQAFKEEFEGFDIDIVYETHIWKRIEVSF